MKIIIKLQPQVIHKRHVHNIDDGAVWNLTCDNKDDRGSLPFSVSVEKHAISALIVSRFLH